MKNVQQLSRLCWSVLLIGLAACNSAPPSLQNTPTAVEATATVLPDPTISVDPTATTLPTNTPEPVIDLSLAPALIDFAPVAGARTPIDSALTLYFDQPMDQPSVAAALSIAPAVTGNLEWLDAQTVRFQPDASLAGDTRYLVKLAETAQSLTGNALINPQDFIVQTSPALGVAQVIPSEHNWVSVQHPITVMFTEPVVPLGVAMLDAADLPNPVRFSPSIPGSGTWLNTTTYQWTPREGLVGGTQYEVIISPFEAPTGLTLAEPALYTFRVAPLRVESRFPEPSQQQVPLDSSIRLTFKDSIANPDAVQLRVTTPDNTELLGEINWDSDNQHVRFEPTEPLPHHSRIMVETIVTAPSGATLLSDTWEFETISPLQIVTMNPQNDETAADWHSAQFRFNAPLDPETVAVKISPDVGAEAIVNTWNPTMLEVILNETPNTAFTVTIAGTLQDIYGYALGRDITLNFRTQGINEEPRATLYEQDIQAFDSQRVPTYTLRYCNAVSPNFSVYRLDATAYLGQLSQYSSYSPNAQNLESFATANNRIREWSAAYGAAQVFDSAQITLTDPPAPLPVGAYMFEQTFGDYVERRLFHVVDTHLTLKAAQDGVIVWATDRSTGVVVADQKITLYAWDEGLEERRSATTDAAGIAHFPFEEWQYAPENFMAMTAQADAGRFGIVGARAHRYYGYGPSASAAQYALDLYSDRPMYKPGQAVFLKGIVRESQDLAYTVPTDISVELNLNLHDHGAVRETFTLNEFGSFATELQLPETLQTGTYEARILLAETEQLLGTLEIPVTNYRKPTFAAELALPSQVTDLTALQADVSASYFFGAPVANANVSWTITQHPQGFNYTGAGNYAFQDWTQIEDDETVFTGNTTLSDSGTAQFSPEITADSSKRFTLTADVTDANGDVTKVSGQTSYLHTTQFVGIGRSRYFVEADEATTIELLVVDVDQQPVAGQRVTLDAFTLEWERGANRWRQIETPAGSFSATTAADGKATLPYTFPAPGRYRFRATITDTQGHIASASQTLYAYNAKFGNWFNGSTTKAELTPNQDLYTPGDVAEIFITSPFTEPAQALISVERGSIHHTELITVPAAGVLYTLPIEADYAPNVYVNAVLVAGVDADERNLQHALGTAELTVDTDHKLLNVAVSANTALAQPGDDVRYTVNVTDPDGNPTAAELSLSLVDLALLQLADSNGYSAPSLLENFYSPQPHVVSTQSNLNYEVDGKIPSPSVYQCAYPGGRGGGGGGGDGLASAATVRTEFEDTAYWNAFVQTDENGQAQVEVSLPDNLTTWQMDARGITKDTQVGAGNSQLIVQLPLLIRPNTPQFLVVDDQVLLSALVANNTTESLDVLVSMLGTGIRPDSVQTQPLTLAAGAQATVAWPVTVEATDWVDLTFRVESVDGAYADASKPPVGRGPNQQLPVYRYSAPDIVGTSGMLSVAGTKTELLAIPQQMVVQDSELAITTSAGLPDVINLAAPAFAPIDYENNERLISRLYINAQQIATDRETPALRDQIDLDVQALLTAQHDQGGWGWTRNSRDPNFYITLYALLALKELEQAGVVDANDMQLAVERAQKWGTEEAQYQTARLDDLFQHHKERLALYVHVGHLYGWDVERYTAKLLEQPEDLSAFAMALLLLHAPPELTLAETQLVAELVAQADLTATGVMWSSAESYWGNANRTSAAVLIALMRNDPDNPLISQGVRALLQNRLPDGDWGSTHATAWALLAIYEWVHVSGAATPQFDYEVSLNNAVILADTVTPTVQDPQAITLPAVELMPMQANRLAISKTDGPGALFYTAFLEIFQPVESLAPRDHGIQISREYRALSADCAGTDCPILTSGQQGQRVLATLTINVPRRMGYVTVDDWIPAGADIIGLHRSQGRRSGRHYWWPDNLYYFDHNIRPEGLSFYATWLPAGTYELSYELYLRQPGTYNVLPPLAKEEYRPDVYGRGAGMLFAIDASR